LGTVKSRPSAGKLLDELRSKKRESLSSLGKPN